MINPKTNERELAYIVKVDEVKELEGYDRIAHYRVNGWWCVSGKGDYQVGDLAIYIEIDSLCPYTEEFKFLDEGFNEQGEKIRPDRHKIKTQKFCKGKAVSQGLLCPLKDFPQLNGKEFGDFVTKELGITYYEPEDNTRKASSQQLIKMKVDKYIERWSKKHTFLSRFKFIVEWKKKSYENKLKRHQKKKKTDWPSWVVKTDEERCQNCFTHMKNLNMKWITTEKIDGTSTTFTMKQDKPKKRELIVCSRNVVYNSPEKEDRNYYKDSDGNVYLEMASKYRIKELLSLILDNNKNIEWITLQGETYGGSIQKRNYGKEHRLAIFNLIYKEDGQAPRRYNPIEMKGTIDYYNEEYGFNVECVPVLDTEFELPETCDELLNMCGGKSKIDGEMREGIVLRTFDGEHSFKAVDNQFLLKWHNN